MAETVYDPEQPGKQPVEKKESVAPEHERAISAPKTPEEFQKREQERDKAATDRNQDLRDFWRDSKDSDEADGRGFFRSNKGRATGVRGIFSRRRVIGLGVVGAILAVLFGLSGLLSTFKADYMMSNIDEHVFARLNGSLDTRNVTYIRTYMELRLTDVCASAKDTCDGPLNADKDNLLFRSDEVKRSKNPVFNWYRTLRSSAFEQDVFQKNGIVITSSAYRDGKTIRFRAAKISVKGNVVDLPSDIQSVLDDAISKNNWSGLNSYFEAGKLDGFVDVNFLKSNSAARAAIKDVVNSNTQPWQVFKRRQLRKDISNKTGVTKWRFFDDTRTKIDAKKLKIRNQIIDAITPSDTKTGKFIDCLFGISDCKFSPDPANPDNNSGSPPSENASEEVTGTDAEGKPVAETIDYTAAKAAIEKSLGVVGGVFNAGNWASMLNSLAGVDKAITSGAITAQVAIARGIQAMALYQTFETMRDQIKTGEANSEEVNQFMEAISNFTAAEAWTKVVEGKGSPTALAASSGVAAASDYCSSGHQAAENQYAYLCNSTVIGGASGAKSLQQAYNKGPGVILHPILSNYEKTFGWFGNIFNKVFGPIFNTAISAFVDTIPGLKHTMEDAIGWATGKVTILLGAGPLYGSDTKELGNIPLVPSGQLTNGVIQGAAATMENSNRVKGAALTTSASQKTAVTNQITYENDQTQSESLFDRYLSSGNPNSLTSGGLFALSQIKTSSVGSFFGSIGTMFKTLFGEVNLPLSHSAAAAAASSAYAADDLAQIKTYDFPPACFNLNPITAYNANPDGTLPNLNQITNLTTVLPNADISQLNISTLMNSGSWFAYLAQQPGYSNPLNSIGSKIKGEEVYNCALLDNSVMGDLGNLYGYTADNGYNGGSSTQAASQTTTQSSGGSSTKPVINKWQWNGGNSFTYNVSNASSCTVETDNPAGGQQKFSPTLGKDSGVTAGNGGNGKLTCSNSAGSTSRGDGST